MSVLFRGANVRFRRTPEIALSDDQVSLMAPSPFRRGGPPTL